MRKIIALLVLLATGVLYAQSVVGVNLELSGRFATIGNATLQGIETALAQLGNEGSIELSVCDNATTVEGSVACANRFVDEGVVAVLGAISSSMSIPAAEVLQDAGVIMVSTSSTNPATTQIGDYIFRMAYTDDFQGKVASRYALEELGAQNAIVFRQQDDDYSFGLAGFFVEEFEAAGGTTTVVDYVANTVDFSAQINDILGVETDVIYYSGFCAEGATLIPALREAGFEQQLLGADASDDSQCPVGGGEAFDGYLFTGFGGPDALSGAAAERASAFAEFFNEQNPDVSDFNGFTLAGADSMNVVAEAIAQAGGGDGVAAVRDALAAISGYPGVSGEITYEGTDGTPSNRTIAFFEYHVPADNDAGWDSSTKFGVSTGGDEAADDDMAEDGMAEDGMAEDGAMDDHDHGDKGGMMGDMDCQEIVTIEQGTIYLCSSAE